MNFTPTLASALRTVLIRSALMIGALSSICSTSFASNEYGSSSTSLGGTGTSISPKMDRLLPNIPWCSDNFLNKVSAMSIDEVDSEVTNIMEFIKRQIPSIYIQFREKDKDEEKEERERKTVEEIRGEQKALLTSLDRAITALKQSINPWANATVSSTPDTEKYIPAPAQDLGSTDPQGVSLFLLGPSNSTDERKALIAYTIRLMEEYNKVAGNFIVEPDSFLIGLSVREVPTFNQIFTHLALNRYDRAIANANKPPLSDSIIEDQKSVISGLHGYLFSEFIEDKESVISELQGYVFSEGMAFLPFLVNECCMRDKEHKFGISDRLETLLALNNTQMSVSTLNGLTETAQKEHHLITTRRRPIYATSFEKTHLIMRAVRNAANHTPRISPFSKIHFNRQVIEDADDIKEYKLFDSILSVALDKSTFLDECGSPNQQILGIGALYMLLLAIQDTNQLGFQLDAVNAVIKDAKLSVTATSEAELSYNELKHYILRKELEIRLLKKQIDHLKESSATYQTISGLIGDLEASKIKDLRAYYRYAADSAVPAEKIQELLQDLHSDLLKIEAAQDSCGTRYDFADILGPRSEEFDILPGAQRGCEIM